MVGQHAATSLPSSSFWVMKRGELERVDVFSSSPNADTPRSRSATRRPPLAYSPPFPFYAPGE